MSHLVQQTNQVGQSRDRHDARLNNHEGEQHLLDHLDFIKTPADAGDGGGRKRICIVAVIMRKGWR